MVTALLIVCIIFLLVAFATLAGQLENIRRVLHTQGRTIDSLNHVDTIQARQLDMQRHRLDDLRPLVPFLTEPSIKSPYCPAHQVNGQQNGTGGPHENH
jgi:hypothetical protein